MKTIDQFKCDYVDGLDNSGLLTKMDIIEQNLNAIDAIIEFAQRWIPVEEELPETNEFEESKICLVKNKYRIDIGRYYSCQKRWFPADMEVTHWRQIEMD